MNGLKEAFNDPGIRGWLYKYLGFILMTMSGSYFLALGFVSIAPDVWFLETFTDHERGLNVEHTEFRSAIGSNTARMDLLDGRMDYQEAAFNAHGFEYDELSAMIQNDFEMIQQQIQQTAYTQELARRQESLESQRRLLYSDYVRLKRIYDGNAAAPATQLEIDEYVRVSTEMDVIDRQLEEIRRLNDLL